MRRSLPLRVRMLVRPLGAVAGLGVGAGLGGVVSAYLPWFEVAATVEMLGDQRARAVATLAGWQAHPWAWLVPTLALAGAIVNGALAAGRPFRATRALGLAAGLGLAAVVAVSALRSPPVSRFDRPGSRLRELAELSERLPHDVALTFAVRPALGLWVAAAAAVVLVAVAAAARGTR